MQVQYWRTYLGPLTLFIAKLNVYDIETYLQLPYKQMAQNENLLSI